MKMDKYLTLQKDSGRFYGKKSELCDLIILKTHTKNSKSFLSWNTQSKSCIYFCGIK